MSTLNEAGGAASTEAGPIGAGQAVGAGALYLAGLAISAGLSAYDAKPAMSACLTALNAALSWALLRWGLGLVRVSRAARFSAVLWVPLAWNFLLLSQLPYLGFFFIPLEALIAALMLRRRTTLPWGTSIGLGAAVRLLSLALTYAARPAVKLLCWRPHETAGIGRELATLGRVPVGCARP